MTLDLTEPVDADDVGMLEPRDRARLDVEALPPVLVPVPLRGELDRHVPVEKQVLGDEHLPHRPRTERPTEPVVVEGGGRPPGAHGHGDRAYHLTLSVNAPLEEEP